MYGGGAFVVLMIVAAAFFPSNPLGNFASMMIWAFIGTIATLLGVIALFIGGRLYQRRTPKAGAAPKEQSVGAQSGSTFLPSLVYGLTWVGIPTIVAIGLIAYTIAPNLIIVPNMIMLAMIITAIRYGLKSATEHSKVSSAGKKEPHSGLAGISQILGRLMLLTWILFLPGYYLYYTPGTLTHLLETSELSGPEKALIEHMGNKDLPQNTLLDPGLSMNDSGKWVARLNIHNPHILNEGVMSQESTRALLDAANGYPMQISPGSYVNTAVKLSVIHSTGEASDGIVLYNGNCLSPTMKRGGGQYTLKTCTGNWKTQSNSMMGVYSIVFNNTGRIIIVDLYEGSFIKGIPDMKLILSKKGD